MNPAFEHATARFFVALKDGKIAEGSLPLSIIMR